MAESYEFRPPAEGLLGRAYYTPVSEALRGQLTGSLDIPAQIAAAKLPAPLPGTIYTVVRRCRLWRRESVDVARELINHFADGLAAGRSVDELTRDFGSPEQAAKLIRVAKLRNRSLFWRAQAFATRTLMWGLAIGLVFYFGLAARFFLSRPNVAHNYWHEINAARKVADDQRAWPLYREAALKIDTSEGREVEEAVLQEPVGKDWDRVVGYLQRNARSLELAREGAKRPRLGYYVGDPADREAALAMKSDALGVRSVADENGLLVEMNLVGVQALRTLARLLLVDARRAAVAGESDVAILDLTSLLSMSEQLYQPKSCLIEQLVGMALHNVTMEAIGKILASSPQLFSDVQLRDMAHRLAAYPAENATLALQMERMWFDDLMQRGYTDNGHGDGHMTPEGITMLESVSNGSDLAGFGPLKDNQRAAATLLYTLGPAVASLVGGRAELSELYDRALNENIRLHQGPPWQWNRREIEALEESMRGSGKDPLRHLRNLPVVLLQPAYDSAYGAAERTIQTREATEVAIALVLYRRRHDQWPTKLAELVPDLLPAVPADRHDGEPLRYTLRDGQPLLYSIGPNRKDDGGQPTEPPESAMVGSYGHLEPQALKVRQERSERGDWILWPPLVETKNEPPQE